MERISEHATANRIYDEFEPLSNWKTEQGFETLTVYLPGFKKEQLKVQVTTTKKLRVMGDRRARANKWIRFRTEFPIPPNIDVDSISAKFEGANLVVKLLRPEAIRKQNSPIGTTSKPPLDHKESLNKPLGSESKETRGKEAEEVESRPRKPERESEKSCSGIRNQDYRSKVTAYSENLGGYVALMKNNKTSTTAGVLVPAAAVLLLSLVFYAGQMFTS